MTSSFPGMASGPQPASAATGLREAAEYVALFAPPGRAAAYQALISPQPLDAVLRSLAGDPALLHPPGAWTPRSEPPLDAFGRGGPYDRSRLARLYGGRSLRVARGPRAGAGGRVAQSWSLFSPYPDPSLERLQPGTLVLVLTLP
jgi:hypothetical protein